MGYATVWLVAGVSHSSQTTSLGIRIERHGRPMLRKVEHQFEHAVALFGQQCQTVGISQVLMQHSAERTERVSTSTQG